MKLNNSLNHRIKIDDNKKKERDEKGERGGEEGEEEDDIDDIHYVTVGDIEALAKTHKIDIAKSPMFGNKEVWATNVKTNAKDKIAVLDQTTGVIKYEDNEIAKAVLNAQTHDADTENRAQVFIGLMAKNACGEAIAIANSVFPAFFLRPIDIIGQNGGEVLDAKDNGDYVSVFDLFTFEDWRNEKFTKVVDGEYPNLWYFGFYNIKSVSVDLANVKTDMNGHNFDPLATINPNIKLSYVNGNTPAAQPADGMLELAAAGYNNSAKVDEFTYNELKKHFGYIKYENKGTNLSQDCNIKVPVTVEYEWGKVTTVANILIKATKENNN